MKQKLFLTSCIAMGVVAPAVAEPTYTSDTFPSSGLMQEDYTYTNAATADNMDSVYEGTVNAVAEYNLIDYILSAGQYLPKDSDTQTTCPAGSFCAGGTFQYDEDSDQGLTSCSTATSGLYALSAAGASSQNECYRTCTTTDVSHSTGVSGNYYYGDNNQCEPTACVKGWHIKPAMNASEIASTIGNTEGVNSASISDGRFGEMNFDSQGAKGQTYYGLTDNNTWAVDYGDKGMLIGQGRSSAVQGVVVEFDSGTHTFRQPLTTHTTSELGDEGGQYCYCNLTGYKDASGDLYELFSPWVFINDSFGSSEDCADFCANNMRLTYSNRLAFRAALLETATSDASAMCTATNYRLSEGQYLPADGETVTTCPAGYFCSGIGTVQYNQTSDQGIQSCPSGYALSAAGASSQNECYRTCTTTDIAHSTGVTGGYYYGDNNQCSATGCVNGWHLKTGISGSELSSTIGNTQGVNSAMIDASGTFSERNWDGNPEAKGQTYYGLNSSEHNSWAVDYGSDKGVLVGQARCSTQSGNGYPYDNPTIKSTLTDETGEDGARYCWCNVTGYKNASGALQSLSSSWVFSSDRGGADYCANDCAIDCAYMRVTDSRRLAFRAALLGSVQPTSICEANTITINWSNAEQTDIDANNAGTATYGEDVRTPVKAETIKGKTFLGWKFSKPEQTNLPN